MRSHLNQLSSGLERIRKTFSDREDIIVTTDLALGARTRFRTGGAADLACEPKSEAALIELLKAVRAEGLPLTVLGAGSNVLVSDRGVRGVVCLLTPAFSGIRRAGKSLIALAGTKLCDLAATAAVSSLSGLEFAAGIPGSAGGAVTMNAGAYGGTMADVVSHTVCILPTGDVAEVTGKAHEFGYRTSLFKRTYRDAIIMQVTFSLETADADAIYRTMYEYGVRRTRSQPLAEPSGGSAFKRPPGHYAGKLISDAGLKGRTYGPAGVSAKHAGFIVHDGTATASDIAHVFCEVQREVDARFGIRLEPEVRFVGEWDPEVLPILPGSDRR